MDLFQQLPWRITDPNTIDTGTKFLKEETIAESFVYKNNFVPIKEDIVVKKPTEECKTKSNINFGQKSKLNKIQHAQCLKALELLQSGRLLSSFSLTEQQVINIYNNLRSVIVEENSTYLKFAEKMWNNGSNYPTSKIKKAQKSYVRRKWKLKLQTVNTYDQFYQEHKMIPLSGNQNLYEMNHEGCLLELGNVAELNLPNIKINNGIKCCNLQSFNSNSFQEHINETKHSVSRDIFAEYLAQQTNCNVVISSSGLKAIIDNFGPDFDTNWDVPVVVKEHIINGKKSNIVYVDKAFPQKNITIRDLNHICRKIFLKFNLCKKVAHSFETPKIILDYFMSRNPVKTESNIPTKNIKQKVVVNQNVSYRLWNMKNKEEGNILMKGGLDKKQVKLLIRTKTDAFQKNQNGFIPINLAPKSEYQSKFGGELVTQSELLRQWTTLFFRPFSNLLRIRIDERNKFVKIETMNLNKIANECTKHYNFTPTASLGVLFNVLSSLSDLPPGNYLLHHAPKHGPFVALMKSCTEEANNLNLHKMYAEESCSVNFTNNFGKWNPIDKTLILPFHLEFGIMPGLFPPFVINKNVNLKKKKKQKLKRRKKNKIYKQLILDEQEIKV